MPDDDYSIQSLLSIIVDYLNLVKTTTFKSNQRFANARVRDNENQLPQGPIA
jgi:hypothetical protein